MTALDALARSDLLFLNWRDPTHPQAGGAETYCFEIARRMADAGARVTLFTSRYPGAAARASMEGVTVLRGGGTYGVYLAAALHMLRHRHSYEAVVDFQNGIPFFSPAFVSRWTADVGVVHHVHQEQFDLFFRWPMNAVGRVLEKHVSRVLYRRRPLVAVSPSSREAMRSQLGFRNPIFVVPNGSPRPLGVRAPRSATPAIAVVSRLTPQKRVHLLVEAVPELLRRFPGLRVDIAGSGSELSRLRARAAELGLGGVVRFHGRVSEERKRQLLAEAWLTVVPSAMEGWGLTVIEANSVGTPTVAYDVPGLRDAIQHGHNGWLLGQGTDLAAGTADALTALAAPAARDEMARRCAAWASEFTWAESAERFAQVVHEEMRRVHRRRKPRRKPHDLSTVTRFEVLDGDALERRITTSVRETDLWARRGGSFAVLLHGCDEMLASRVLRRLGVHRAAMAVARRRDVLVPPEPTE